MSVDLLISSTLCDLLQAFNIFKTNTAQFIKNIPHPPQIFDGCVRSFRQISMILFSTCWEKSFIWRSFVMVLIPLFLHSFISNKFFNRFVSKILLHISIPWGAFLGIRVWKPLLYSPVTHRVVWGQAALASPGSIWEMRTLWLHCRHSESNSATKIPTWVYTH